MSSSLRLAILALIILVPALIYVRIQNQIDDNGKVAFAELDRVLGGGALVEANGNEADLIRPLLTHKSQWDRLRELDAKYPTLAFHPDRSQVYFLHDREHEESGKSCFGVVTVKKSGMENHNSHSGFPLFMRLNELERDGDTLTIKGLVRSDTQSPNELNGVAIQPGQELVFEIHTDRFQNATIGLKELGPPLVK